MDITKRLFLKFALMVGAMPLARGRGKICFILTTLSVAGLTFSCETAECDFALLFNGSITAYLVGICRLIALVCSFSSKNYRLQWLGIIVLVGLGWWLRWVLVIPVQTIALQNPYHFDWLAVDSGLGIVSIFGLVVLVSVVVEQVVSLVVKPR